MLEQIINNVGLGVDNKIFEVEILKDKILECLEEHHAENIEVINLLGKSDIADYMIIATGKVAKHTMSLADYIMFKIKNDVSFISCEGMAKGDWVLIDLGDVIIHLFRQEIREFYNIEKMWNSELLSAYGEIQAD